MRVLPLLAVGTSWLVISSAALAQSAGDKAPAYPSNQSAPTISGKPKRGETLTVDPGIWAGTQPITFSYQWMRCLPYCRDIAGATSQTYTLTKADTRVDYDGLETVISATVTGTNMYGSGHPTDVDPGVLIDGPFPRPPNRIQALFEAFSLKGTVGEIPELLRHNGYTAHYFVLRRGRVDVSWTPGGDIEDPRQLAAGHGTFRHVGHWVTFKVRLTKRGRQRLQHADHLTVYPSGKLTPLHHPERGGGYSVGTGFLLRTDQPAENVGSLS